MKRSIIRIALGQLLVAGVALAASPGGGEMPVAVRLGAGSELWLEGKSTIHDFESRSHEVTIVLTRDPAANPASNPSSLEALIRSSGVRGMQVEVPVRSLRSDKSGLDKNLWKNLRAEQHPTIRFHLAKYDVAPAGPSPDTLRIRAEGTLEVAGATRPDTLDARAWRTAQGVWIEGDEPLLMSDFGIHPPSMMLGTLRVKDRIVVRYRLLLVPASEGSDSLSSPHQ